MKFTKEQIEKAMACKSVDELLKLAKSEGVELTHEQAEAYFAQSTMNELSEEELAKVAGGVGVGLQLAGFQNQNDLESYNRCKCDDDVCHKYCMKKFIR